MKTWLIAFLALAFSGLAQAGQDFSFPPEVSAVLISPQYAKLIAEQRAIALQSGRELRIGSSSQLDLGAKKYVYLFLATRVSAAGPRGEWTQIGSIAGQISSGPQGEIIVEGVFFKPVETFPGGASVGNH